MQSISKESTEPELPFSRSSCKSHGTKCWRYFTTSKEINPPSHTAQENI
jgi:hypothetical protein